MYSDLSRDAKTFENSFVSSGAAGRKRRDVLLFKVHWTFEMPQIESEF